MDVVMALLHGGDPLDEVTSDERRALPCERAGQRTTRDVLGDAIEQAGERDLVGSCWPVAGEDLVGLPAEEQGVHAPSRRQRACPATVRSCRLSCTTMIPDEPSCLTSSRPWWPPR